MAVRVNEQTRVVRQGLTGSQGAFRTGRAAAYGTKMVGGETHVGLPAFDTMAVARARTGAIIARSEGGAEEKIEPMKPAGIVVAASPAARSEALLKAMSRA